MFFNTIIFQREKLLGIRAVCSVMNLYFHMMTKGAMSIWKPRHFPPIALVSTSPSLCPKLQRLTQPRGQASCRSLYATWHLRMHCSVLCLHSSAPPFRTHQELWQRLGYSCRILGKYWAVNTRQRGIFRTAGLGAGGQDVALGSCRARGGVLLPPGQPFPVLSPGTRCQGPSGPTEQRGAPAWTGAGGEVAPA